MTIVIAPKIRKMTIAVIIARSEDAALGGREHALDGVGEARRFAALAG